MNTLFRRSGVYCGWLVVWAGVLGLSGCAPFRGEMLSQQPLSIERAEEMTQQYSKPYWRNHAARAQQARTLMMAQPLDAMIWASLDADLGAGKPAWDRTITPKSTRELWAYASWLKWQILLANANPRFSYAYASNLYYMKAKDGNFLKEAAIFFFHARLALEIDGARCVDRSSPGTLQMRMEYMPSIGPLIDEIARMPEKERAGYLLEAVGLEEYRGERPVDANICLMGIHTAMRTFSRGQSKLAEDEDKTEQPGGKSMLGRTEYYSGDRLDPDLIDENQWSIKRREILHKHVKTAVEMLK